MRASFSYLSVIIRIALAILWRSRNWIPLGFAVQIGGITIVLVLTASAHALTVDTPLPDLAQEARARALFHDLRCMVCQGESIADSPAEVASDMRRTVRERIAGGDSDAAIKQYLASRYGDAVLMRPPLRVSTWALWFGPLLILLAGGWMARRVLRK